MKPRPHEVEDVLRRYRTTCNVASRVGEQAVQRLGKAMVRFRKKVAAVDFDTQSPSERKNTWLRLCHRFVKSLKADSEPLYRKYVAKQAALRGHRAGRGRRLAARHRVQERPSRLRAREDRVARTVQGQLSVPVKKYHPVTYRLRRLASRAPVRIRRRKSTTDPAVAAERLRSREQAFKSRQELRELRSRKRAMLFRRRMEWLRRSEAGEDLSLIHI